MNRCWSLRTTCAAAAIVAAQLVLLSPASAHDHPTPVELALPGVVFVETAASVEVTILEHRKKGVAPHVKLLPSVFNVALKKGSGFAVSPVGDIVTTGDAVTADLRLAEIYAVNRAFNKEYGVPMPSDPFSRHRPGAASSDPDLDGRLQQCYTKNVASEPGGCVIAAASKITVYPYVTSQAKHGALPATLRQVSTTPVGPIAVLKVSASTLPTVNLAKSAAGAQALSLLGFKGTPGPSQPLVQLKTHLATKGGTQLAEEKELAAVDDAMEVGLAGGPVVAESGQVVGFLSAPQGQSGQGGKHAQLVNASDIQSALAKLQVTPALGPTYFAYEGASHNFKNKLYAAAIPGLNKTLEAFPGHYLASQNLTQANKLKNTAADLTGKSSPTTTQAKASGGSGGTWVVTGLLVALAAVAAGVAVFRRRRRQRPSGSVQDGDPPPSSTPLAARPVASRSSSAARPSGKGSEAPALAAGPTRPAGRSRSMPAHDAVSVSPQNGPSAVSPAVAAPGGASPAVAAPDVRPGVGLDGTSSAPSGFQPKPARVQTLSVSSEGPKATAGESETSALVPMYCTECGQRSASHHRFCKSCGAILG